MKNNLNIWLKIIGVFFIIFHFHPTNYDGNWLASISYFALLILLTIDVVSSTVKMMKQNKKRNP